MWLNQCEISVGIRNQEVRDVHSVGKNFIQIQKTSQTLSDEPPSYCANSSRQTNFLVFPNL